MTSIPLLSISDAPIPIPVCDPVINGIDACNFPKEIEQCVVSYANLLQDVLVARSGEILSADLMKLFQTVTVLDLSELPWDTAENCIKTNLPTLIKLTRLQILHLPIQQNSTFQQLCDIRDIVQTQNKNLKAIFKAKFLPNYPTFHQKLLRINTMIQSLTLFHELCRYIDFNKNALCDTIFLANTQHAPGNITVVSQNATLAASVGLTTIALSKYVSAHVLKYAKETHSIDVSFFPKKAYESIIMLIDTIVTQNISRIIQSAVQSAAVPLATTLGLYTIDQTKVNCESDRKKIRESDREEIWVPLSLSFTEALSEQCTRENLATTLVNIDPAPSQDINDQVKKEIVP